MSSAFFLYGGENMETIEFTDLGDTERKIYVADGTKEKIVAIGNDDDVLKANYEGRKEDGFDFTRSIRRVAHKIGRASCRERVLRLV